MKPEYKTDHIPPWRKHLPRSYGFLVEMSWKASNRLDFALFRRAERLMSEQKILRTKDGRAYLGYDEENDVNHGDHPHTLKFCANCSFYRGEHLIQGNPYLCDECTSIMKNVLRWRRSRTKYLREKRVLGTRKHLRTRNGKFVFSVNRRLEDYMYLRYKPVYSGCKHEHEFGIVNSQLPPGWIRIELPGRWKGECGFGSEISYYAAASIADCRKIDADASTIPETDSDLVLDIPGVTFFANDIYSRCGGSLYIDVSGCLTKLRVKM